MEIETYQNPSHYVTSFIQDINFIYSENMILKNVLNVDSNYED